MDLGPTLLHLAGITVPEGIDGTPFLGEDISLKQLNDRDEVYGYGDRFDELYAFNRTVRKGDLNTRAIFNLIIPSRCMPFIGISRLLSENGRNCMQKVC